MCFYVLHPANDAGLVFCRLMMGFLSQLHCHGMETPRIHPNKPLYSQRGMQFLAPKLLPSLNPVLLKLMFCMSTQMTHKFHKK